MSKLCYTHLYIYTVRYVNILYVNVNVPCEIKQKAVVPRSKNLQQDHAKQLIVFVLLCI